MTHAAVEPDVAEPTAKVSPWTTRTVPWAVVGEISEDAKTAKEAAALGGLNFEVEKWYVDGVNPDNPNEKIRANERAMLVRQDTKEWLGIMSRDYPILQYDEAFDFMDLISPSYVAAGALKKGRQGFMVVQPPETIKLLDDFDPHELFAVLRTSHDGSRAIEVSVMPLRYKCMNQLTLASFSAGVQHRWSIKHTSSMHDKLKDAQISLASLGAYAKQFEENAHRLLDITLTDAQATELLTESLPKRPRTGEQITTIINSWHTAETVGAEFDWTGWGLLNATSEYFDWGRSGGSPESRFVGALQGQTYNAINKLAGNIFSTV